MTSPMYLVLIIAVAARCNFFTRAFPFLLFSGGDKLPSSVEYLGKYLPPCVMMVLVVYCLKGMTFASLGGFLPEIIAVVLVVMLHLWKRNNLISIAGGTIIYMFLIQVVFK